MKTITTLIISWLLLASMTGGIGCNPQANSTRQVVMPEDVKAADVAIVGVNLIPMTTEGMLPNQTVVIRDGKIWRTGPAADMDLPDNLHQIDGKGKYLVPGIAEMHAHIPVANDDDELVKETLFLYLSNGVTTIRGMLGNPYHLQLRADVAAGNVPGPRIFTSGPSLNGNSAPSEAVAIQMVKDQKAAGYDFLKLHPGLKRPVFDAIVKTANEVGIEYAGHVSIDVGIDHAIASKYASIDHVDGYLEGLVPASAGVDLNNTGWFGFNFVEVIQPDRISELARATQAAGVAVVPTQSLMERISSQKKPEAMADEPEMQYMDPQTVTQWKQRKFGFQGAKNYTPEAVEKFVSIRRQMIKALHDAGTLMLLGSDAPQIFNVPGFSIQHEMKMMIDAGLTPYQTLVMGTVNPARYFGANGQFGTIEKGASADLILLNKNPLEDITHMRQIAGVIVRGKWLSQEEIQKRLDEIAAKYASND